MNKLLITAIFLLVSFRAYASPIVYGTTYTPNGQVTSTNLNGNFNNVSNIVNGNLDNTNANTTSGYRFYQTVSVLPSAGSQGAVYFLTSDNSLNFDTGAAFNKSVSVNSPVNGDTLYYNSGWNRLAIGANGTPLISNGTIPVYGTVTALGAINATSLTSLSSTPSGAGVLPIVNAPLQVFNYGTSTSTSSPLTTGNLKIAYGTSTGTSFSLSNLPFTSSTSYFCVATPTSPGSFVGCNPTSGSAATISTNTGSLTINWIAIGT